MNLKARLKAVETKLNPPILEPVVFFITLEYPVGKTKPPLIGYQYLNDKFMRLENESDDDLKSRVYAAALENIACPDNSFTGGMVLEILEK